MGHHGLVICDALKVDLWKHVHVPCDALEQFSIDCDESIVVIFRITSFLT